MKKYKLTDQNLRTHTWFQWEIGVSMETDGSGELCSKGWLHYYHHPLLAVLFNPIHANIFNPRLFEVSAKGIHKDDLGRKGGCTKMTLVKEIPLPSISITQKVAFAILCAKKVYLNKAFLKWADNWLLNIDRNADAARASARAADAVAYAADDAAHAAAYAADAHDAADARASARAAHAVAYAAYATVYAADAAYATVYAAAAANINLIKIAKQAMKY